MNVSLETAISKFLEQKKGLKPINTLLSDDDYPIISVGVCTKNSEATICECLKSIVNSDYDKSKLEIILVDGKSVDKTIPIGQEILEKSGIAFKFFNDEGKGLGYARQMVVDAARGEYVCWVDSDNVVPRSFLKTHAEFAKKQF